MGHAVRKPFEVALAISLFSAILLELALFVWLPQLRAEAYSSPRIHSTALSFWLSGGAQLACSIAIACGLLAIHSWTGKPVVRRILLVIALIVPFLVAALVLLSVIYIANERFGPLRGPIK
jgi:hypothetical protein